MAGIKISNLPAVTTPGENSPLAVADGGITKQVELDDLRTAILAGALSTVNNANLTANRAVISDAAGKLAVSATVSDTEVGYLDGASSNIQTQLNLLDTRSPINLLANGNFDIFDLGTSFASPADVTWMFPGWVFLRDTDVFSSVSQQTGSPPSGSQYYTRFVHGGGGTGLAGLFQIMRAADAIPLRGKTVSLSVLARTNVGGAIGLGIYVWTGTADAPTVDFVSTWAMPPTSLAANWTAEGTSLAALTGSFATYKLEAVLLDTASFNNIGIFVGTQVGGAVSIDICQVQMQFGSLATEYVVGPLQRELMLTARNNYVATGAPGTGDDVAGGYAVGSVWINVTADDAYICLDPTLGAAVWKKTTP